VNLGAEMGKCYKNLREFIKNNLSTKEFPDTQKIINALKGAKRRGYFTKKELLKIGLWKVPKKRNVYRLLLKNSEKKVIEVSRKVFSTNNEKRKIELLDKQLKGVAIPMASAILMLTNPRKYGVIDFWVWRVLYKFGEVKVKPKGVGLNFNNWYTYLAKLRYFAKKFKVKVRDIERTIYDNVDRVL